MTSDKKLENILSKLNEYNPSSNTELVIKAFEKAACNESTKKTLYKLGELLTSIKAGSIIIASSFLYFPIIQGKIKKEELESFGEEINEIIDPLSKFDAWKEQISKKSDIEKLLRIMTKNPKVIIILLALRVLVLEELKQSEKGIELAKETLDLYSPIAHKLGINKMKKELEDLSIKFIDPKLYSELQTNIKKREKESDKTLEEIKQKIIKELKKSKINARILARPKHIYSIYKKMKTKNKTFDEIYDLRGLRIIPQNEKECYEILGLVHSFWKPLSGEFDDYIAKPKPNMYQSLHTTLIGPDKRVFEIQIRTEDMDKVAENGIAMHWKYKGHRENKKDKQLQWAKQIMDWQNKQPSDILDSLKMDLFEEEIFAFTPRNEVIELPKGATALDFAFAIHTDIGNKCSKTKVNRKLVPLGYVLNAGDQVEITTSKEIQVKRSWLNLVKTSKAMSKIKQKLQMKPTKKAKIKTFKNLVIKNEANIKLAKCCNPLPGDNVIGFYTTKRKTIIHRNDCENAILQAKEMRIVKVEWEEKPKGQYNVEIKIEATERPGLLTDILEKISKQKMKLKFTNAKTGRNNKTFCNFTIEAKNVKEVQKLMENLKKVKGILHIERG